MYPETNAHRMFRYASAAVLTLAFVLSFFSCIRENYVPFFPERMDGPYASETYIPMLPGFLRFMLPAAGALLLIGRKWAYIASIVMNVLPVFVALKMQMFYQLFEFMGGLGRYEYSYTLLGMITAGLVLLGCAGQILTLVTHRTPKRVH